MQAQDRAHRIGQTREVTIYRLITENTVEMNMLRITSNKKKMNTAVIGDGKFDTETLVSRAYNVFEILGIKDKRSEKDAAEDRDEKRERKSAIK